MGDMTDTGLFQTPRVTLLVSKVTMAVDTPIEAHPRHKQMFPVLTEAEIERIGRFGTVQRYERGTQLVKAGEHGPGMFVILKGTVTISQRDGFGRVTPIATERRGHFVGEVAQLSGGPALVDAQADEDVEALRLRPEQLRALII